jgi:hypothetical protein
LREQDDKQNGGSRAGDRAYKAKYPFAKRGAKDGLSNDDRCQPCPLRLI